jgi:hypothetical protein
MISTRIGAAGGRIRDVYPIYCVHPIQTAALVYVSGSRLWMDSIANTRGGQGRFLRSGTYNPWRLHKGVAGIGYVN